MLQATGTNPEAEINYEQLPPLPVRLFKEFTLKSIPDEAVTKTMTSSGTTGQQVSRIYLDRGQALFEVERDPRRPFRVSAGETQVTAIGTPRIPSATTSRTATMRPKMVETSQ